MHRVGGIGNCAVRLGIAAAMTLPWMGCAGPASHGPAPSETQAGHPASTASATPLETGLAAPSSAGVFSLPSSIDPTGAADSSAILASFVASVPDGSTIEFAAGGVYRLDHGLHLVGRKDLVFAGNGATLAATATTGEIADSPFFLERSTGITIRDLILTGNNPDAGTSASHHPDRQDQGGVMIYGGSDILIEDTTMSGTWGDCVYVGANAGQWADGVTYRDSVCERNGRQALAIIAARAVVVERVQFDEIALSVLDIEPNYASEGAVGVTFQDNTVGTYGLSRVSRGWFFAADGAVGSTVRDITVTGNVVTGRPLSTTVEVAGRQDITFADNTSLVAAQGPVLRFAGVEGLTVSGNVQPLISGPLLENNEPQGGVRMELALLGVPAVLVVLAGLVIVAIRSRRLSA